jgi:N-acetyl-gamma-glutamyl-phosphate reductase
MLKVGIVGGTGYTGVELLRLLSLHPDVELTCITSRAEVGQHVSDFFPSLRQFIDLTFVEPSSADLSKCDVVFFATPHGVAMSQAQRLLDSGVRIIDLAADFRMKNLEEWSRWYSIPHDAPELLGEAVYGLPELNREKIRQARLVGNPGCYATAIELGFAPLLLNRLVDSKNLIADAKSGVSGAGRKAELGIIYSEVGDNFKAYGVDGHRHHPEIVEVLSGVSDSEIELHFTPHLLPINRGILATLYSKLTSGDEHTVRAAYTEFYKNSYFVDVLPRGTFPDTRSVRGSNFCKIGITVCDKTGVVKVISVIDNLVKGAAGQAVQNMNIMFGLNERLGLDLAPLVP